MIRNLFDLSRSLAGPLLRGADPFWTVFDQLGDFIVRVGEDLDDGFEEIAEFVWAGPGTVISASVRLKGPAIIGRNVTIGAGCELRDNLVIGDGASLGTGVGIGGSVVFDEAGVRDGCRIDLSILGLRSVVGAGAVLLSRERDGRPVELRLPGGGVRETGRPRLGSFLCDGARVEPGTVLAPGAVVAPGAVASPG